MPLPLVASDAIASQLFITTLIYGLMFKEKEKDNKIGKTDKGLF